MLIKKHQFQWFCSVPQEQDALGIEDNVKSCNVTFQQKGSSVPYCSFKTFILIDLGKKDVSKDSSHHKTIKQLTRSTSMELYMTGKDCVCPCTNFQLDKSYVTKSRARSKNVYKKTEDERSIARQIDVGCNSRRNMNTEHAAQTDMSYFKTRCTTCQKNISYLDNVSTQMDSKKTGDLYDEFDIFGKSVACQLRNIDFENAMKLQKRIQDLIAQERLDNAQLKGTECSSSDCSECRIIRRKMLCSCGLPVIMIKMNQSCELDATQ